MYGHLKRGLLTISSHRTFTILTTTKAYKIKWQGLDLHGFLCLSCLLSQGSLISSVFIALNDMTRAQYRVDYPSACTTAWHRILMLLMSWPAENKRPNSTQKNMFFLDSSWPLHHAWCSFCSFSIETLSHISKYCPFPEEIFITSSVSF